MISKSIIQEVKLKSYFLTQFLIWSIIFTLIIFLMNTTNSIFN